MLFRSAGGSGKNRNRSQGGSDDSGSTTRSGRKADRPGSGGSDDGGTEAAGDRHRRGRHKADKPAATPTTPEVTTPDDNPNPLEDTDLSKHAGDELTK